MREDSVVAFGKKSFFREIEEDEALTAKFFKKTPIIIYRRWKEIILNYLKQKKIKPNIKILNDNAFLTMLGAMCGLGVGILPLSMLQGQELEKYECTYHYIEGLKGVSEILIVTHPEHFTSSIALKLIEEIIANMK